MSGQAILVVGATGTGKTTFVKKQLAKVNKSSIYIYDVNNEYKEFQPIGYTLPDFETFTAKSLQLKNAVILFEEATIFLDSKTADRDLIELLIKKRHKNNTVFLVFHGLTDVPKYLFRKCTHLVLHKTNDSFNYVKAYFGDMVANPFLRIAEKSKTNRHYHELIKLY